MTMFGSYSGTTCTLANLKFPGSLMLDASSAFPPMTDGALDGNAVAELEVEVDDGPEGDFGVIIRARAILAYPRNAVDP